MVTPKWFEDALLINRDPNWYHVSSLDVSSAESTKASMEEFFKMFTQYAITDVQICVFENTSIIPSQAMMWRGEKFIQKEENGIPVSYPQLEGLYKMYREYNLDPVQSFIDIMKAGGVRPWITIRMNDAHFGDDQTSFLRDDFFYKAKENGWMIGDEYGYYGHCLDYAKEPVRARMLAFIREILDKYDVFGLELDFMREIHSFDYKRCDERHAIMNNFIKQVRQMLKEAGEKYGHPFRLMIRTHRSIEETYEYGFDVATWVKEGWVDAIVPTARWEIVDDAIPVAEWKKLVGEDIALFPGIEILHLKQSCSTEETTKAYSAAWNAQGADGLYFNNHDYPNVPDRFTHAYSMHRDTVLEGTRRYIVTYQDISTGLHPVYHPLPKEINGCESMTLRVGPIRATDTATLILEFEGDTIPAVRYNGIEAKNGERSAPIFMRKMGKGGELVQITGENTFAYACPGLTTGGELTVEFCGKGTLTYLECRIESVK